MADAPSDNSLFQDLVLEMQMSNQSLTRIDKNTFENGYATLEVVDRLDKLIEIMTGNKLQEEENRREMLKAMSSKGGAPAAKEVKSKGGKVGLGGIIGLIAGLGALALGFIAGFIAEVGKLFNTLLGGLPMKFFAKAKVFTSNFLKPAIEFVSKLGAKIAEFFKPAVTFIKEIGAKLGKFFEPVTDFFKFFKGSGGGSKIVGFFMKAFSTIKTVTPVFFKLGKLLGKLALPVTVIMGVIDTLTAGFKAAEEGASAGDVIKESIIGLLNSIIAAPLNILKDGVAWILGAFGFENAEEALDSFDFGDFIGGFIDTIVEKGQLFFENIFNSLFTIWDDIKKGFSEKGFIGGILEILRGALKIVIGTPLNIVKSFASGLISGVGKLFSFFGADGIGQAIQDFAKMADSYDVNKLFGGTQAEYKPLDLAETGGELVTNVTKRQEKRLTEEEDKKKKEEDKRKKAEEPLGFYGSLLQAYQNQSGANMQALQSDTAEMAAASAASPTPVVQTGGGGGGSVTNTSSSVSYTNNNIPDRTNIILGPAMAGI